MKTINRGYLKRLAQKGNLVLTESYNFDDMHGASRGSGEVPVRIKSNYSDRVPGYCNLDEDVFSGAGGNSYQRENGEVVLHVHSNLNYTFRILS